MITRVEIDRIKADLKKADRQVFGLDGDTLRFAYMARQDLARVLGALEDALMRLEHLEADQKIRERLLGPD